MIKRIREVKGLEKSREGVEKEVEGRIYKGIRSIEG